MLITFRTMSEFKAQLVDELNRIFRQKSGKSPEYIRSVDQFARVHLTVLNETQYLAMPMRKDPAVQLQSVWDCRIKAVEILQQESNVQDNQLSAEALRYVLQRAYRYLYFGLILGLPVGDYWRDLDCKAPVDPFRDNFDSLIQECDRYIEEQVRGFFFLRELDVITQTIFASNYIRDYQLPFCLCRAGKIHIEHLILYVYFKQYNSNPSATEDLYTEHYQTTTTLYEFLTRRDLCPIFKGTICPITEQNQDFRNLNLAACAVEEGWWSRTHLKDIHHTALCILKRQYPAFINVPENFIAGFEKMITDLNRCLVPSGSVAAARPPRSCSLNGD